MLYPLLHCLERHGYVQSSWQTSGGGPAAQALHAHRCRTPNLAERQDQWAVVVRSWTVSGTSAHFLRR